MLRPHVLERLPMISARMRRDLSIRAHNALANAAKAEEARAIISGIAQYEFEYFRDRLITVGLIHWEPFEYQHFMRGFHGGQEVAKIEYTKTHKTSRKEVFRLSVLGREQEELIHHVPDARTLGSEIYSEQAGVE